MRRPADVIGRIDGESDHPRRHDGGDGVSASEDDVVGAVPAHVDEPVDGDHGHREQRHDAADDTEAGGTGAQPVSSTQQPVLTHHRAYYIQCQHDTRTVGA